MKKKLRVIYAAFILSLLIIISIGYISSQQVASLIKYSEQVSKTDRVMYLLSNLEKQLIEAENSQRGFYLTKDSSYLKNFENVRLTIYKELEDLRKEVPNESSKNDLIKIKFLIASRLQILQESIDYAHSGDKQKFKVSVTRGKGIMDDFKKQTSKFEKAQSVLLAESEAGKRKYELAAPVYLKLIFIISVVFQLTAFVLIVKEFTSRHKYQQDLERKVNELNMSHSELEQIAFIASHDLQEPLRKMRTFGGRLLMQYKNTIDDDGQMMLSRIDFAARRMQGLIADLVDYTHLINSNEEKQQISLNECIEEVRVSLANLIQNHNVKFEIADLPSIEGFPFQLHLLFTNIIHNSIKFSKPEIDPIIQISYTQVNGNDVEQMTEKSGAEKFIKISVADNGIGFENEFAKKIFVIFQRLHNQNSSYGGKGIGLSICKRVVTNHNGYIDAEGEPDKGATFNLYFPV